MKLKTLRLIDILPLPAIYYDARKDYHMPDDRSGWVAINERHLSTELLLRGFNPAPGNGDVIPEVHEAVNRIQKTHHVDFVGRLAGWERGFYQTDNGRMLITESTKLIQPVEGEWDMLQGVLERMLGDVQLPYLYGWLKTALEALHAHRPRTGQALVLCGPKNAGKNLLCKLITAMFGGRVAKPYQFMTGKTSFNYDLFEAATLAIEDESGSREFSVRQKFADAIKDITANEAQRCHRKYGDPVTLHPCWRLVISLNDEPERMLVLPPIGPDIEDKMTLFKVQRADMPMHTSTTRERDAFWSRLMNDLPGFLHFLNQWQIPAELRDERFGVTHFHHRELVAGLQEFSPEDKLRDLINEIIFGSGKPVRPWIGKAEELRSELRKCSRHQREVDEILTNSNSCGTYLGRLRTRYPDRYKGALIEGHTRWTIEPEGIWRGFSPLPSIERITRIKGGGIDVAGDDYKAQEAAAIARVAEVEADRIAASQRAADDATAGADAA